MIKRREELNYVECDDASITLFKPSCANNVCEVDAYICS